MTWLELCRQAVIINNLAPRGQNADAQLLEDTQTALGFLLSEWSRDGILEPAIDSTSFVCVGNQNIYTAGPAGDIPKRPLELFQAILSGANLGQTKYPIEIAGWDEFEALTFPSAQGNPSYVYYNPTYPLGTIAIYPTPNSDWTITLTGKFAWDAVDINAEVSLPPGYDSAILDALAVKVCENYNRVVPIALYNRARDGMSGIRSALPISDKAKDNMWARSARPVRNWQTDNAR